MPACVKCHQEKGADEFYRRGPQQPDLPMRHCKRCHLAAAKRRRDKASPEERAETHRKWKEWRAARTRGELSPGEVRQFQAFYLTMGGRATHMLNNARARARGYGVELTITRAWILERLQRGICEATGLPFVFEVGYGKGHWANAFAPSIDRLARLGAYSPENCVMTCWIYNRAKGAFSEADFARMALAYATIHKTKETP